MRPPGSTYRAVRFVVLGVALLVCIGYLLALALRDYELVKVSVASSGHLIVIHNPKPWLLVAAVAAVLVLLEGASAERRAFALRRRLDEGSGRTEEGGREQLGREQLSRIRTERDRLRDELEQGADQRERLAAAWRSEREWVQELRDQIRTGGIAGRHDDIGQIVLELTMSLVGAEHGFLVSRREMPGGELALIAHIGFEDDAQLSALAQRFSGEVVPRATTIREENLLAIPMYVQDDYCGAIVCANRPGGFGGLDEDVLVAVGEDAADALQNARLHSELRNA